MQAAKQGSVTSHLRCRQAQLPYSSQTVEDGIQDSAACADSGDGDDGGARMTAEAATVELAAEVAQMTAEAAAVEAVEAAEAVAAKRRQRWR